MSREKQIEEMALILDGCCNNLPDSWCETYACSTCKAEQIYNAGYRKQRVGEWKKVSDKYPRYVCTACNHLYNNKGYKYCPNCGAKTKGGAE